MGLILVQSERVYILFDSLKYFNRVSYLKNVALKAMISVLVASLWNFTNIFFGTVFLCYFLFSIFHLLLRFSKNYLVTFILFFCNAYRCIYIKWPCQSWCVIKISVRKFDYWTYTFSFHLWCIHLSICGNNKIKI